MSRIKPHPIDVATAEVVIHDWCEETSTPRHVVFGDAKARWCVRARWDLWRHVREAMPHLSITELAWVVGRDHTTLLHAFKKMELT
jgi:chromosomal replication initiation ATPase DnaA